MTENQQVVNMPVKLALIIDGEVVDILHTDHRLGAIFLSEPTIIDVSDHVDENGGFNLMVKATYNSSTGEFTNPEVDPATQG